MTVKSLKVPLSAMLTLWATCSLAQELPAQTTYAEVGAAFGPSTFNGVAALHYDWNLGRRNRLVIGTGARFTGFAGADIDFITAPANLTVEESSIDTLFGPAPRLYSLNLMVNLGYRITERLQGGFSIDALGLSFGPTGSPQYIRNGSRQTVRASPTPLNLLLVGDNDRGSLNSMFYLKYLLGKHFGIKLGYQYLFNELTTESVVQTVPERNDRFRYKSSSVFVGLNYTF